MYNWPRYNFLLNVSIRVSWSFDLAVVCVRVLGGVWRRLWKKSGWCGIHGDMLSGSRWSSGTACHCQPHERWGFFTTNTSLLVIVIVLVGVLNHKEGLFWEIDRGVIRRESNEENLLTREWNLLLYCVCLVDPQRNVVLWQDHRAATETEEINSLHHHPVLRCVGGALSPEMQPPKLLWLKRHSPWRLLGEGGAFLWPGGLPVVQSNWSPHKVGLVYIITVRAKTFGSQQLTGQ